MALSRSLLILLVVLPGAGCAGISAYFLFPEWKALEDSHLQHQKLAQSGAGVRELSIAQAAETRHRLNCFAEGVGALLGWGIASIGIHGLCTLPKQNQGG
jgi:hypothetical protein